MKMIVCVLAVVFQFIGPTESVAKPSDNIVGQNIVISSQVLSEQRQIQIHLPDSYKTTDKKYPVLYILDGQRLFLYGVSVFQSITSQFEEAPEFIVVGISNRYPDRFRHFTGVNFINFLENEVITHIDDNYRTSDERLIFAWEYAGSFAFKTLIDKPDLFDGYIIASPYPIDVKNEKGETEIDRLAKKLTPDFKQSLFFTVSKGEGMVEDGTRELERVLSEKTANSFNWTYRILDGEEHRSTAYPTLYRGLRHYFDGYGELFFPTLADYETFGGMAEVYNYYQKRSKRYGFSEELPAGTMWSLLSRAEIAGDFEQFQFFIKELEIKGLFEKSDLGNMFDYADFYVKNNQHHKAINFYKKLVRYHTTSARIYHEMGNVYALMRDSKNAIIHHEKAVTLARENNNDLLVDYTKSLELVKEK